MKAGTYLESGLDSSQIGTGNHLENIKHFCSMLSEMLSAKEQSSEQLKPFVEAGYLGSNWWCAIAPKKADGEDIDVFEDLQQTIELSSLLYDRLKTAPSFRYAIVGIEVDQFITYEELICDELITQEPERFSGLVLSEAIWRKLGCPDRFLNFRQDYFWIPFIG